MCTCIAITNSSLRKWFWKILAPNFIEMLLAFSFKAVGSFSCFSFFRCIIFFDVLLSKEISIDCDIFFWNYVLTLFWLSVFGFIVASWIFKSFIHFLILVICFCCVLRLTLASRADFTESETCSISVWASGGASLNHIGLWNLDSCCWC